MLAMTGCRGLAPRAFAALLVLAGAIDGAAAGQALDALDGRWTPSHCADPATGTWTVFDNRIQFFWPTDRNSDALEEVVREEQDVVETVVVSPDAMKGARYRYSIVGDDVLIDNLSNGNQQVVHRCR
jgi:hypothetical protein